MSHPDWVRTCADCSKYVIGDNGEVSDSPQRNERGETIWLPMVRPEGVPPPCDVCPKHDKPSEKKPLPPEEDLFALAWFWDARQEFLERRACQDFAGLDAFMRAVFTEYDQAERRLAGQSAEVTAKLLARIAARK